jgi:predicted ATP-grasp superfamily ATP-dependent carboligase
VQWTSVIAQGWIPGGAETLFWCLAYLDENSRCIAQVTGNKTRLWPPQSGNSSLCRTQSCPSVTDETIRILETLGLVGFASIEYKYDARDDTYYILEPTIGRCDQQIAIGRAAGVNLPDIALRNLANGESPTFHQRDGTTMMWEIWDIIARWHPQQDCRESYLKHLTTADLRMLSSISDTGPLFASLGSLLGESLRTLSKKLIR